MKRCIIFFAALVICGGCTAFKPPERAVAPVAIPQQYSLYTEGESRSTPWWHAFNSPELNHLVETALADNFDLQIARRRMQQAEAAARMTHADQLPKLDYNAGVQQQWMQTQSETGGERTNTDKKNWFGGAAASYEIDLWGRLDAQRQAQKFILKATQEDLSAATVTVVATIVQNWIDLSATRREIAILENQIQTNQTLLELQRFRFLHGKATALVVAQQREALAVSKAEQPLLAANERRLLNSLAFLCGKTSVSALSLTQTSLPQPIPVPETGLPADLIASRPDVRAAGLRLRSSDWSVSAARADRLPSLTLSFQSTFSSPEAELLFHNWINTLAAGISGPLFDCGRREAATEKALSVAQERLADYARVVANAIREVEDSLIIENQQQQYIIRLTEQLQAAGLTRKDAQLQYQNGQSDYLAYFVAWTSVQTLQRKLVREKANLVKDRVALYRTLGGGWSDRAALSAGRKSDEVKKSGDGAVN